MTEADRLRELLETLANQISPPPMEILVFGSGALALQALPEHRSQDFDIATNDEGEARLLEAVRALKLEKTPEKRDAGVFYIEVNPSFVFSAPRSWRTRAKRVPLPGGHAALLPDPLDILVSKIPRFAEKDREDIREVFAALGRPKAEVMLGRFREAVLMYRPSFDEWSFFGDPWTNTKDFFREFYDRAVDVRREIVMPGLAALKAEIGEDRILPIPPRPDQKKKRKKK